VLFAVLLSRIDLTELGGLLLRAKPGWIGVALGWTLLAATTRAVRWWILLRGMGIHTPFLDVFHHSWVGASLGLLTPGKLGELSRAAYLVEKDESWVNATYSVIVDRLLDVLTLALFSLWGLRVWMAQGNGQPSRKWLILPVLVILLAGFLLLQRRLAGLIQAATLSMPSHGAILGAFGFSAVTFLCLAARVYALALAAGWAPSWWAFLGLVSLAFLVMTLPVSILNIGTRDLAFLFFFGYLGLDKTTAIAISSLLLLVVIVQTLVGVVLYLKRPPELAGWRGAGRAGPEPQEHRT
jgi:uncharacterized membrane protein YbhN (UPF0104 family)